MVGDVGFMTQGPHANIDEIGNFSLKWSW